MKVLYNPEVIDYLTELSQTLSQTRYFGSENEAIQYVEDLLSEINLSLDSKLKKEAAKYFSRYGEGLLYATYRTNKQTSWYVFFHCTDDTYLVRYIGNNHSIGQYF